VIVLFNVEDLAKPLTLMLSNLVLEDRVEHLSTRDTSSDDPQSGGRGSIHGHAGCLVLVLIELNGVAVAAAEQASTRARDCRRRG